MGSHELLVFWVLPLGLLIRAVALRTEPTGFCNGNAAGAGGRSTVLITSPGFLLIETKTLAHVSGKRHAGDFRG